VTWYAAFRCLNCQHSWREPAPPDAWEMVLNVAAPLKCPLCGAEMRAGSIELLSHREGEVAVLASLPYAFNFLC
jgi:hypothetical protein